MRGFGCNLLKSVSILSKSKAGMSGINIFNGFNVLDGTDEQRRARMQMVRHPFKNTSPAIAGLAARMLCKKSQRSGFAHEAQLALGFVGVWRVHVDTATNKGTVKIGNKRAHVT